MKSLHKASSLFMKNLHKDLKKNKPKEYYLSQYEKFKKVGKYSQLLKNSIKVRNFVEKEVGDIFIENNVNFEYEPYINLDNKVYFPDFKIENKIIEVTAWRHPDIKKIQKLRRKLLDYSNYDYNVKLFIPKDVKHFYREFDKIIISDKNRLLKFVKGTPKSL